MNKLLSIVVPCYNEEEVLPIFHNKMKEIEAVMDYINFEYVFVDDGSKDNTLHILRNFSAPPPNFHIM